MQQNSRSRFWFGFSLILLVIVLFAIFINHKLDIIAQVMQGKNYPGQGSLEISGINGQNPIYTQGNTTEHVTLMANTPYELTYSASGTNCNYHYTDNEEVPVHGKTTVHLTVPKTAPGEFVAHDVVCTSSVSSSSIDVSSNIDMLIINIAQPQVATPTATTSLKGL